MNVDFIRFDLTVHGGHHTNQWKRNAILIVVRALCEHGATPGGIADAFLGARKSKAWLSVEGELSADVESFKNKATAEAEKAGRRYDDMRWHTREGDLVVHSGRTYCFTSQWGIDAWLPCMVRIKERFPDAGVDWSPTDGASD